MTVDGVFTRDWIQLSIGIDADGAVELLPPLLYLKHDTEPFSIEKRTDPRLGTTFEEKAFEAACLLSLSPTRSFLLERLVAVQETLQCVTRKKGSLQKFSIFWKNNGFLNLLCCNNNFTENSMKWQQQHKNHYFFQKNYDNCNVLLHRIWNHTFLIK